MPERPSAPGGPGPATRPETGQRALLEKGQRVIDRIPGAKVIDARAVQGAVELHLMHRGCDDDACIMRVPLDSIWFADEEEPA